MKTIFLTIILTALSFISAHSQLTYDASLDSFHIYDWDKDLLTWEIDLRVLLNRDVEGNLIESYSISKVNENIWENNTRHTFLYNEEDLIEVQESFSWYDTIWVSYGKTEFSYDDNGNTIEIMTFNGNDDIPFFKTTNTFDDLNRLLTSVFSRWEEESWFDYAWTNFIYNAAGNIEIEHHFGHVTGSIYDESRTIFEYDNDNRLIRTAYQNPLGGGMWDDLAQSIYSYSNNIVTQTDQSWSSSGWKNTRQHLTAYNTDDKQAYIISKQWNDQWLMLDSTHYYYMTETGLHDDQRVQKLEIYPNPASSVLNIKSATAPDFKSLFIYSSSGELRLKHILSDGKEINIKNLVPGHYYVVTLSGKEFLTGRFIKQ